MNLIITTFILICIQINFKNAKSYVLGRSAPAPKAPAAYWDYKDVKTWCTVSKDCCGTTQSPIALKTQESKITEVKPFRFVHYHMTKRPLKITNNGHSVVVLFEGHKPLPRIEGGGLKTSYNLHSFHMHWGPTNKVGAEHIIDGHHSPLELHLVHIRKDFNNSLIKAAISKDPDSIAVLGIVYGVDSKKANVAMKVVTSKLKVLTYKYDVSQIPTFDLRTLLPKSTEHFFRYYGSLTIPDCTEHVVWTVFKDKNYISDGEMKLLRTLRENKRGDTNVLMLNNHREIQPLNSRDVIIGKETSHRLCKSSLNAETNTKLLLQNDVFKDVLQHVFNHADKYCY